MAKLLRVVAGPDEGRVFSLNAGDSFFIGRSQTADLCLSDSSVSRMHCRLRVAGDSVVVVDVDSRHGTFVNESRVKQQVLQPGDVIRLGLTQIRFGDPQKQHMVDPLAPAPVSQPAGPVEQLADLVGQTLSHYEVGPVLAKGRSGLVFQSRDTENQRIIALKVLWPDFAKGAEDKQRFIRAMKTMMALHHPNLVNIYNAGKTGPYRWIAMEYVRGKSLQQVIQRISTSAYGPKKGKWSASEGLSRGWWLLALRAAVHLCRALDFAYNQRIIHRNITPQNILIESGDNVAKLGDLMLAKALEGPMAEQITVQEDLLGDLEYMSPERTFGRGQVDYRSDIYSLGAALYALLTGRPPLAGKSRRETLIRIREDRPVPPKEVQPSMPAAFEKTVLRMLAKHPDERFQTPADVLERLEPLAEEHGLKV